jgi:hypothetical protein
MGLLLVGEQGGFTLPLLVQHPAMGALQALMQLVAKAPRLLQGSGDQRLEGSAKLGGEFGFGVKLGNHNQGDGI